MAVVWGDLATIVRGLNVRKTLNFIILYLAFPQFSLYCDKAEIDRTLQTVTPKGKPQYMDASQLRFCIHNITSVEECYAQLDLDRLKALFELSAFWARDRHPEEWAIAIANSDPVVTIQDGERLIGFARATSDGIYRGTIWDVVVHPEYRGVGLGTKLVETVLSHPKMNRVERVYLMTTHKQSFYKHIGFEENASTTMVLYNQQPELELAAILGDGGAVADRVENVSAAREG